MCLHQERRRQEIDEKVQQSQELEKQVAQQERKDLFQQRRQQKTKIARLAGQMELVAMVCYVSIWQTAVCNCEIVDRTYMLRQEKENNKFWLDILTG